VQAFRALLNIALIALASIVGSVAALIGRLFDSSGDSVVQLARLWSRFIVRLAGVRITVRSHAELVRDRPYVFMSNHLSTLDIWAAYVAIPIPVRMIAKKQLARIPLFGWAMTAGRFIFIDRQNAVAARRSIERAKERIHDGTSVLIFPEGTRSRDGKLAPFKKGGFHLAMDAGVPIVPVAMQGTRELMPRGSLMLRPGRMRVTLGAPIPTDGLSPEDRSALVERVHAAIAAMLEEDDAATLDQ
jgi:1-acyl-sn-glycerol-3-phosphate acyltransferase